jgi:photosystem II stability/assembly factor-like uncharacterized protein
MKIIRFLMTLTLAAVSTNAQWVAQNVDTTASLRGLSVVNEKIVWASGTGGTIIRTVDGGKTWKVMTVPGADKLDFRDIEAFDANTAYILSIGNGESSRIYKTTDGGKVWNLQFKNTNDKAFFDAIACRDQDSCLALSDPVNGKFLLLGPTRPTLSLEKRPPQAGFEDYDGPVARDGEAAFAASGTCLVIQGSYKTFIVTGGKKARVFQRVADGNWDVSDPGFASGTSGSGIFSLAMFDLKNGVIVGGNYEKPDEAKDNLAFTSDGGETWKLGSGLTGYRSGVTYVDRKTIIAVGTNGSDITRDGGKIWKVLGKENLNAVQAKGRRAVWAVGPKGLVVKMK